MLQDLNVGVGITTTNCLFINAKLPNFQDSSLISHYIIRQNFNKLFETVIKLKGKSIYFISPRINGNIRDLRGEG